MDIRDIILHANNNHVNKIMMSIYEKGLTGLSP